jgi:hypothetical protein
MCSVDPVLQFMEKLIREASTRDFLNEQGLCRVLKFSADSRMRFGSQFYVSAGLYPQAQHHHLSELMGILQATRKSRKTTISLNKVQIWSCLSSSYFSELLNSLFHILSAFLDMLSYCFLQRL